MKTAKIFQNGQSQAVRLPKEFRFSGDEVYIKKSGKGILLLPHEDKHPWSALFNSLHKFTPDFMDKREQPEQQKREDLFE